MFKIYYAGRDPKDHNNFTRFAVAAMEFNGCHAAEMSKMFSAQHPELFEVGIEVDGRKFNLASGTMPIEF